MIPPRRLTLLSLLLVLALPACGGDGPTPPDGPTVASVVVTPTSPTLEVGKTLQMSAIARDPNGGTVTGVTVTWTSSDAAVASVDAKGLVTGVAAGAAAITATVAGVAGSQVVTVVPDQCDNAVTVVLDPGEHQAYPATECLFLPSGSAGDYYRLAVYRPTQVENPSDVSDITVETSAVSSASQTTAAVAPPPARAASPPASGAAGLESDDAPRLDGTRLLRDVELKRSTSRFHMQMLEREIRERGPGPDGVLRREAAALRADEPRRADPPARLELTSQFSCSASPVPQTLVAFNDDIAFYQDSAQRVTKPIAVSSAQEILDYYDAYVKDMIPQYWGTVTDLDGNGRVLVTTSPALGDSVAAAIFTGDLRTSGSCAASNQGEVIFYNVDLILDMEDLSNPGYLALPTLAHEMKHLVSIYNRFAAGASLSPLWIEEGTSEISAEMSSRIAWAANGGPAPGEVITRDKILATLCSGGSCNFTKETWGVVDILANAIVQISTHPNSLIVNPNGAHEFHSIYASGWHYHRFLGDAFGNASSPMGDAPFFKEMVDSTTASGTAAHAQLTGRSFDQLFEDLVVAMSLHQTEAPPPARAFSTWDFVSSAQIFAAPAVLDPPGTYPWPRTADASSGQLYDPFGTHSYTGKIGPAGMHFYDFQSTGSGSGMEVTVTVDEPARVIVTRIR